MSCQTLALGVQASCLAVKKPGGVDKRVWIGLLDDVASITLGTGNILNAFVMKAGKGLTQWTGRREKNSAGSEIEIGENVTVRNQLVSLSVYWETAAQLTTLDELLDLEGLFVFLETNAGLIEVFGVNMSNAYSFTNFGLKPTKNSGNSGKVINDATAFALELSGGLTNLQLIFRPTSDLASNILYLNLKSVDPVGS